MKNLVKVNGCTLVEGEDSNLYDVLRSGESPDTRIDS
jgi:hypothetical protein